MQTDTVLREGFGYCYNSSCYRHITDS